MMLSVENISKRYFIKDTSSGRKRPFWALKDVSFELVRGECVGLVGVNGSGKSTLLKIISRIVTPTHGQVRTFGSLAPLLELGAGFHDELTGRENAIVYASLIGIKRKEVKRKLDSIVHLAGIAPFLDTKLRGYSNGMRIRLAFSIVSHLRPDILLADEILNVGDESFQKMSLQKILELKAEGTTIIIVQHDHKLIEQICDRSIELEKA